MKKLFLISLAAISLISCNKECDDFHEGKKCEKEIREKHVGVYTGSYNYGNGATIINNLNAAVAIVGTDPRKLTISAGSTINITLIDAKNFEMPLQNYVNGNITGSMQGSGSFIDNNLTFSGTDNSTSGTNQPFTFTGTK